MASGGSGFIGLAVTTTIPPYAAGGDTVQASVIRLSWLLPLLLRLGMIVLLISLLVLLGDCCLDVIRL